MLPKRVVAKLHRVRQESLIYFGVTPFSFNKTSKSDDRQQYETLEQL